MRRLLPAFAVLSVWLGAAGSAAQVPTGAEIVLVRSDCASSSLPGFCFSSMAEVNAWIPTRTPPGHPVLIDVGPGDWDPFSCSNQNDITIRGAGREVTRIVRPSGGTGAMAFQNCHRIAVESLTAHGSFAGVTWSAGGSSTWSDTDMLGGGAELQAEGGFSIGWYDTGGCGGGAVHYFFGSRARALGAAAFNWGFVSRCEHWFFGGEIEATSETDENTSQTAILVVDSGDIRVFGTAIRSNLGAAVTSNIFEPLPGVTGGMHGVYVQENGVFHAHGSIVNASADTSALPISVTGLNVNGASTLAHTPGTAFVVKAGPGGAASRLAGDGSAQSPFLWQQGSAPPRSEPGNPGSPFVSSLQGADAFVETDCKPGGSCTGGGDPHLLLYSASCTGAAGPWFDVVTGSCRAE